MLILEAPRQHDPISAPIAGTVLQSHHYLAALHRAITETGNVDGRGTLERAASIAAYRSEITDPKPLGVEETVRKLITRMGLGGVDRVTVKPNRVEVVLNPSDFASTRRNMFGVAALPACDATRGLLAGSIGALLNRKVSVREIECIAAGGDRCRFIAEGAPEQTPSEDLEPYRLSVRNPLPPLDTGFPPQELLAPLLSSGDGIVGASYGRLWAEFYARATAEFEAEVPRVMGAKFANLPSVLLTEAAHLATFYSIGGLIRSTEWHDTIVPVLQTREEWVHAIVGLLDGFGWGAWRIRLLAPEQRFTVQVYDSYEAISSLALSGPSSTPRCYSARGVVAGLMNVLYAGDAIEPAKLDMSVYNRLFRSPMSFRALETRCQAMGDPFCEFVANPLSPGLRISR